MVIQQEKSGRFYFDNASLVTFLREKAAATKTGGKKKADTRKEQERDELRKEINKIIAEIE